MRTPHVGRYPPSFASSKQQLPLLLARAGAPAPVGEGSDSGGWTAGASAARLGEGGRNARRQGVPREAYGSWNLAFPPISAPRAPPSPRLFSLQRNHSEGRAPSPEFFRMPGATESRRGAGMPSTAGPNPRPPRESPVLEATVSRCAPAGAPRPPSAPPCPAPPVAGHGRSRRGGSPRPRSPASPFSPQDEPLREGTAHGWVQRVLQRHRPRAVRAGPLSCTRAVP